jgi:hypothetical protein
MTLSSRLAQLEKQVGVSESGVCNCSTFPHEIRTYMDARDNKAAAASDQRPPQVCEYCQKPKELIQLVVVYDRQSVGSANA